MFDTLSLPPIYLRVDEPTGETQQQLPIVALDGRVSEVARFRHLADAAYFLHRGGPERPTLPLPIAEAARRLDTHQRDLLLDPLFPLVLDDLAHRFAAFLVEMGCPVQDPQEVVRALRERGLGLIDPNRGRSWIDEQVYEGVLYRNHRAEARARALEEKADEVTGEFSE